MSRMDGKKTQHTHIKVDGAIPLLLYIIVHIFSYVLQCFVLFYSGAETEYNRVPTMHQKVKISFPSRTAI